MNNLSPDQLPIVQGNEFLPSIGPWATLGGGVLVATFGAAVTLASVLNYNVTVKSAATIRPAGELKIVQAAATGPVKSIEVKGNQVVQEGQPIAYIDDSRLQTQKSQLQESLLKGQLQLSQIDAQINNLGVQIVAESSLANHTITAAQADLIGIQRDYQIQQISTQANASEAAVALNLAQMQQNRLKHGKELKATLLGAKASLDIAKVQRNRLKQILKSGAISRNMYEEKEQAVRLAEANLEQAKGAYRDQFDQKEMAVVTAGAKLKQAKAMLNPSNAAVQVAAKRVEQEQAKAEATLATLQQQREQLFQNRTELQNQLFQAQKGLQQIKTDLSQTVIRAPIEGTVLQLNLRNPGQVVQPGEAITYIAPINAPLIINARVAAQDISKVKPGQKVQMQVSACSYPDYGTLKGTVKTVAPDALLQPASEAGASLSPASYEVTIQPQTMFVGDGGQQCRLQPGMEGKADIISREETVLKFILRKARVLTDL